MLLVCLRVGVATLKLWHLWFISVSQSTKLRMIFVEAQHVSGSIGHILSRGCQNRCLETKRGDCESDAEFSWSLQFGGSSEVLLVWSGQIIPTWPQPKRVEGKLPSKGFPYPKALFKGGINTKANGFRRSMFSLLHDVANSSWFVHTWKCLWSFRLPFECFAFQTLTQGLPKDWFGCL